MTLFFLITVFLLWPRFSMAQTETPDADGDGLLDLQEQFFNTDPLKIDTDGDGFNDYTEIINQYDPLQGKGARLPKKDADNDEFWDFEEVRWGSDPKNPDTDADGYKDKVEVINGFDPNGPGLLPGWIRMDLSEQTLSYGHGPKLLQTFKISSGKRGYTTPTGEFRILNKVPKQWSKTYGLWMPYWMGFTAKGHGIHELPVWPNGYREGENHLGMPVSHGCVRLGIGPAKELYEWAEVGTRVVIQN